MKFVPKAISRTAARQVLKTQKHSPQLLLGVGVVGVVTSTVLACKATLQVEAVLNERDAKRAQINEVLEGNMRDYNLDDAEKDRKVVTAQTVMALCKLYAPAVVIGSLSVSAIVGSHRIMSKRNAALTAAYAAMEKGFKEYRERVAAEIGEENERALSFETERVTKTVDGKKVTETKVVGDGGDPYRRIFDEYNKNWTRNPEQTFHFIKCQQNWANDRLLSRGHLFLNEVYDALGLEHTPAGAVTGWVLGNGDDFVDFGLYDIDNDSAQRMLNGDESAIWLTFNVDGTVWDKI